MASSLSVNASIFPKITYSYIPLNTLQPFVFLNPQEYLEAGADFVGTNTFSGTSIAQADYAMEHIVSHHFMTS